jgi:hypothetical protein
MRNTSHGIEVYCTEELRYEQQRFRLCVTPSTLPPSIHQQHARRKRIRLLECRHQVLGPLPVQWTPTLSPEHVTCKPFSDTPNPYGMRRHNKGTYEPYKTNNGENHCILSETPLTPMSATASSPRFFAFMMCSQSKMASGAG